MSGIRDDNELEHDNPLSASERARLDARLTKWGEMSASRNLDNVYVLVNGVCLPVLLGQRGQGTPETPFHYEQRESGASVSYLDGCRRRQKELTFKTEQVICVSFSDAQMRGEVTPDYHQYAWLYRLADAPAQSPWYPSLSALKEAVIEADKLSVK